MHSLIEQDVLRLEVTVDYATLVQELERRDEFGCVELSAVHIALGHVLDEVEQVTILGVSHNKVKVPGVVKCRVKADEERAPLVPFRIYFDQDILLALNVFLDMIRVQAQMSHKRSLNYQVQLQI